MPVSIKGVIRKIIVKCGGKMQNVNSQAKLVKTHQDHDREDNERCFLKDKQQIKYHSFILLELIPLEKKDQLFDGLDKLYSDVTEYCSLGLEYRKTFSNCQSKLFQKYTSHLPPIVNLKLKGKRAFISSAFHDLGDNIQTIDISISKALPSTIILQINICLNDEVSQTINDIIYKYHTTKEESIKLQNGFFTKFFSPGMLKESEIYSYRCLLHEEAVIFFRKYFTGFFFNLVETSPSIIPSIDVFSFDYPNEDEEIMKWGHNNYGFLRCFNTFFGPYRCYRYENYLLTIVSNDLDEYTNYIVFANRKESVDSSYHNVDSAIILKINDCDFDLIAIDRLVKQQENHVGKLNLLITQELEYLQHDNFERVINSQKEVIQTLFSFERFSIEYTEQWFSPIDCEFKCLIIKEELDKQTELFHDIKNSIDFRIKKIDILNSLFSREHEKILNLKNLEFNKKMQNLVYYLTIVVIILTIIQVLVSFKTELLDILMKFLTTYFHPVVGS